jgi:hypothetical protein
VWLCAIIHRRNIIAARQEESIETGKIGVQHILVFEQRDEQWQPPRRHYRI